MDVKNLESAAAELSTVSATRVPTPAELSDGNASSYTIKKQREIIHRIDRRLVVILAVLFMCSLLDRTNLAAANIAGHDSWISMAKGLRLQGARYNIIVLVFFIPYIIFQAVATVLTRKVGPRNFMTAIVILWGSCVIGFGFVKSWDQMVGLRIILGVLEAGYFPSCVYLLSCWYTRFELQKRFAVFYLVGSMATALGGILSYGIMQMNGMANLSGWRWIFIIEGILTCAVGFGAFFIIVDFPELATKSRNFLNAEETTFVVARLEDDRADVIPEPFHLKSYLKHGLDIEIWGFASIFGLTLTSTYAIAYFLPIILNSGMHFSIAKSQCLVTPPYAAAAIYMYVLAVFCDKYRIRGAVIALNAVVGLVGLPLLGYAKSAPIRYFGVFLATISCNANVPVILTYQANNVRGQWKRAFSSATMVSFGGIGGIVGSSVFRSQDAPDYGPGIVTTIISNGLILVILALMSLRFWKANKRAEMGQQLIEGLHGFRYTL